MSGLLPEESASRQRRAGIGRIVAPFLVTGAVILKVAGALKFLGIFVAVGGYALIWGWRFAVGFVLLILVHELGHYVEAKRQGLNPQIPVFIPFLGAYVALRNQPFDPWRNALVSVAGPAAGGVAALDGGHILRAWRVLKAGGGRTNPADARRLGTIVAAYTVALIAALALGMVASHVPQTRL